VRAIKEEKRKQLVEICRQTSILLEEIQSTLVPWGVETGKLETLFIAALDKIKEQAKKFPAGWIPVTMGQLGAGSVLRDPARIEAYLSGPGSSHSSGAVQLLHVLCLQANPLISLGVWTVSGLSSWQVQEEFPNGDDDPGSTSAAPECDPSQVGLCCRDPAARGGNG